MRDDFEIRDLDASGAAAAVHAVSGLPLLARYGITAEKLQKDLEDACAGPARHVLTAHPAGDPRICAGLCWFASGGTFLMGGYLKLLAVGPTYQRQGVGRLLLGEMERRVSRSSGHLFLLVSDFNRDAARFYASSGYVQVGRIPRLVLSDVDELVFWKRL